MADPNATRSRKQAWSAAEKRLINDYLRYKIDQVERSIAHYAAIPWRQRTAGDVTALVTAKAWLKCLYWAVPGGRGKVGLDEVVGE